MLNSTMADDYMYSKKLGLRGGKHPRAILGLLTRPEKTPESNAPPGRRARYPVRGPVHFTYGLELN